MDNPTAPSFPKKPLIDSFKAVRLSEAATGDILVRWPRNRTAPSFQLIERQEQIDAAQREDRAPSENRGPSTTARYAAIKQTGDIPPFFLVAWANLPSNREFGKERAYNSGLLYESADRMTRTFLELSAPAPTSQQTQDLQKILGAMHTGMEVVANKRRLADTTEQLLLATTQELLSGKIDQKQAAMYISAAFKPDHAGLESTKQALSQSHEAIGGETARKRPGP